MNVNLTASDTVPDLATVDPSQPVVVMMHYGVTFTTFEWDQAQIDAFATAISGHNVIAIIHGHAHATWQGIPIYNVGSPYYDDGQSYNPDHRGHFSVFRIIDNKIYAHDASWDPNDATSVQGPDVGGWSRVVDL